MCAWALSAGCGAASQAGESADDVPECTGHDRQLGAKLAADPMFTDLPAGLTATGQIRERPCVSASDSFGEVSVDFVSSLARESVVAHFRGVLDGGAWRVRGPVGDQNPSNLLCADRRMDGQQVRFVLNSGPEQSYVAEVAFAPRQQDVGCAW
jgi:hypothetical protein